MMLKTIPIISFSLIMVAVSIGFTQLDNDVLNTIGQWGSLIFLMLFLVTYSSGMASIPWLVNSEIYPLNLIGTASSLAACTNWMVNFFLTSFFLSTREYVTLVILGVCSGLGWVFCLLFLVDTSNNSIRKNISLVLGISLKETNQLLMQPHVFSQAQAAARAS